eukprot:227704-Chlamydomonas_euryale.AAC.1
MYARVGLVSAILYGLVPGVLPRLLLRWPCFLGLEHVPILFRERAVDGRPWPPRLRADLVLGRCCCKVNHHRRSCGEIVPGSGRPPRTVCVKLQLDSSAPAGRMDQTGSTCSYPTSTTA